MPQEVKGRHSSEDIQTEYVTSQDSIRSRKMGGGDSIVIAHVSGYIQTLMHIKHNVQQ